MYGKSGQTVSDKRTTSVGFVSIIRKTKCLDITVR